MNKRVELLLSYYELEQHNLHCYSKDFELTTPKENYIKEFNDTVAKINILNELIEENEDSETVCSRCGRCQENLGNREFCLYR